MLAPSSPEVAQQLPQHPQPCESLKFSTADGGQMVSDTFVPQLKWFVQGHTFSYDARVLPIQGYDLILGADWLEDHSPMWIH